MQPIHLRSPVPVTVTRSLSSRVTVTASPILFLFGTIIPLACPRPIHTHDSDPVTPLPELSDCLDWYIDGYGKLLLSPSPRLNTAELSPIVVGALLSTTGVAILDTDLDADGVLSRRTLLPNTFGLPVVEAALLSAASE